MKLIPSRLIKKMRRKMSKNNRKNPEPVIEENLLLTDYRPRCLLRRKETIPEKSRFPVIDAHNHLLGDTPPDEMISVMDKVGVRSFINVTGNVQFTFTESGYHGSMRDLSYFIEHYVNKYPGRFFCFTMSLFAQIDREILISDDNFTENCLKQLENDIKKGALGLKITKELGLKFKDYTGRYISVDDRRLYPIWEKAGELGIPVLIHTSDPEGFFLPIDRYNEHYLTLIKAPSWSFQNSHFSKQQLLEQRDRVIRDHPGTIFICPHVANFPENLEYVSTLLRKYKNIYIDFSARMDELGRQPYSARRFFEEFQDRILFATDMPVREEVYRTYFRFLETDDEYFEYPDYVGRFGHSRWGIYGLHLPDRILEKIYNKNALRIMPALKRAFE